MYKIGRLFLLNNSDIGLFYLSSFITVATLTIQSIFQRLVHVKTGEKTTGTLTTNIMLENSRNTKALGFASSHSSKKVMQVVNYGNRKNLIGTHVWGSKDT